MKDFKITRYNISKLLFFIFFVITFFLSNNEGFFNVIFEILINLVDRGFYLFLFALGAGIVISTGGIDLSSSGVGTFVGLVFAFFIVYYGINPIIALVLCSIIAYLIGSTLGYFISKWSAPPLILTWAVGLILFKLSTIISSVVNDGDTGGINSIEHYTFIENNTIKMFVAIFAIIFLINFSGFFAENNGYGCQQRLCCFRWGQNSEDY